jgi:hypothetical protein
MELIIRIDERGLIEVDLCTPTPGTEEGRRFFQTLRPHLEKLDIAAKAAGREIKNEEAETKRVG